MQESTGVLKYIPLSDLGRRDLEVRGIKKDQYWNTDSSGALKLHEIGQEASADISPDYKLHRTLQRRGIAMHGRQAKWQQSMEPAVGPPRLQRASPMQQARRPPAQRSR